MTLPHPQNIDDHDPDHYALCLSCHDANKYLLWNTSLDPKPVTTGFRDDEDLGPWDAGDPPINIHEYHLQFNSLDFDSDWNGVNDSEIACVNCHNVHGSTQLSMVRDGRLTGMEPGMVIYYDSALVSPTVTSLNPPEPANITLNNSTGTIFDAPSPGNICGHCHGGDWVKYYRSAPAAPAAPTFDWTGEAGYTTDGVTPDSGTGGDFFTFRINYTDSNSQPPRSIQVWVDEDNSGVYDPDERHDMMEVDSNDVDVSDGKQYGTILSIEYEGAGTITYRFYASDGKFDATGDPTHPTNNTITLGDNVPVLSWTGEDNYSADGVSPDSASNGSSFTFRIEYADINNQCPASGSQDIQVWIDENDTGDGNYESGEKFNMSEVSSGDTDCTDGKLYTLTRSLSYFGDGSLYYRFYASDGTSDATGTPTTNRMVTITSSNTAPTLSWTGETNYVRDGVNPNADAGGSSFTFSIKYSDIDNDAPSSIQVWLDRNDNGVYEDNANPDLDEKIDMLVAVAGDAVYADGKLYTRTLTIEAAGDGIMNYRFYASDGTADATGTPTEDSIVTIIVGAIWVSCPGNPPYDYTSLQSAIDNASDGDTIIVKDGTCTETITIDNKDLTIKSINGAAVTTIDSGDAFPVVTFQNGADTVIDGLTITGGNRGSGYGSGVVASNSSPTLANSIITGNYSQRAAGVYATGSGSTVTLSGSTITGNTSSLEGPGIWLTSGVSAVITNTTVSNNNTTNGSGGGLYMSTSANATLTVSGSTFSNNTITGHGGAMYISASGGSVTVDIESTTISNNSGGQRGAALYMSDSGATTSLAIADSTISGNSSSLEGGAMNLSNIDSMTVTGSVIENNSGSNGGFAQYSNSGRSGSTVLTVSDSVFRNNTAAGNIGGAFYLYGSDYAVSFERCFFAGNSAGQRGGALYVSGPSVISGLPALAVTFENCIVSGNRAASFEGGGIHLTNVVTADIINCTFSGNSAGSYGGGLNAGGSTATSVKNSIFWRNGAGLSGYEINGTVTVSYSDIRKFGGYPGTNNINIDPLFIDPVSYTLAPTSDGDYHLMTGSPAIEVGTATGAPLDDIDNNVRPLGSGVDMGADEVVTVANNAPILTWTNETNYTADGVDPDTGSSGGSFEFRVNYADADNEAPSVIQVWIDRNDDGDYLDASEKITLSAVDGDADYTDGKLYHTSPSVTLAYAGDGVLTYRFYADDGISVATGQPISNSAVVINTAPTIAWLGTGNYVSDGVHPDSGSSGDTFEFRVEHTDTDNNPPISIQVWIDHNDDTDYADDGEKLTMTEVDPIDTDYTDGKEYSVSTQLYYAGDGTFTYRFYASDGLPATGIPTGDSNVTITNTAPALSWIGTGAYMADGVNPNGGLSGSNSFVFRIMYTDIDNQCPASGSSDIRVWIDEDDSLTYEPGEKKNMTEVDAGDTDCTDGKVYTYTATNLVRDTDDYLNYRFSASDGITAATGTPVTTDKQVGVFTVNQPPDLDWTGEAGYTTDGVDPDNGMDGDDFAYRVKYTDIENVAPSSIQVWVDIDDDTIEDGGELTTLSEVNAGDTVYDDGKLYTATITLSSVNNPSTTYHFKASDGTDNATGNATTDKIVTVVTPITVCGSGCDHTSIQAAINAASGGDFIQVRDGTYDKKIDFLGKSVTVISQNGAASTTIRNGGTGFSYDNAVVNFVTNETADAVLDGFTITNQNSGWGSTRGIYISGANPTIRNCIIENNNPANGTDGGGGVYIDNSSPTFDNCTIRDNTHANRNGCGMYIKGAAGGATITNSTIGGAVTGDGNKCTNGTGGGIYYTGATTGTLTITGSNIQYNQGNANGGGLYLDTITNTTVISNSTILDNYTGASGNGGGIMATSAPVEINSGSVISDNDAGANRSGGGIYSSGSTLTISDSTINSNTTGVGNSGEGGGIYFSGTNMTVSKSNVRGNKSTSHGGGIRIAGGTANITNSVIAGNIIANNTYRYGGGIANSGTLNLSFSTVADNYVYDANSVQHGGGLNADGAENIYNSIIFGSHSASAVDDEIRGTVEDSHLTQISGSVDFSGPQPATDNNPTTTGNYTLQSSSNCIDTGDKAIPGNPTGAPADDIVGNFRPNNIAGKDDGIDDYDRGAYEYVP
jgi:predicted outer membrane repeat protein